MWFFKFFLFSGPGKGPQRAEYEEKIRRMRLRHVAFRTLWLSYAEYPRLLGAADLGVCLHASSSGLDLPMKVTSAIPPTSAMPGPYFDPSFLPQCVQIQDMFGCGLPVLAMGYSW